jgi:hypothetical protein
MLFMQHAKRPKTQTRQTAQQAQKTQIKLDKTKTKQNPKHKSKSFASVGRTVESRLHSSLSQTNTNK